jgi:hypothetical protein
MGCCPSGVLLEIYVNGLKQHSIHTCRGSNSRKQFLNTAGTACRFRWGFSALAGIKGRIEVWTSNCRFVGIVFNITSRIAGKAVLDLFCIVGSHQCRGSWQQATGGVFLWQFSDSVLGICGLLTACYLKRAYLVPVTGSPCHITPSIVLSLTVQASMCV